MNGARPDTLLSLAKSREPADRERLLTNIVGLCEMAGKDGDADAGRAKGLIDDLFTTLLVDAEHGVRRRVAERIAAVDWAPSALIQLLALDDIEIARSVIAASPLLNDDDLIRLLAEATLEHQIEIARRDALGQAVVEAILNAGDAEVLGALVANVSARLPQDGLERLVEAAHAIPGLRARLIRHPGLTSNLAAKLYGWAGDALRKDLARRFDLEPRTGETAATAQVVPFGRVTAPDRAEDRDAMEHRLVEKLDAAGQLRPGYLVRALRESKLSLFEIGLARLAGVDLEALRAALVCERPDMLALACVAAGIDRSVFKTILMRVRELNGGLPAGGRDGEALAAALFHGTAPKDAVLAFARLAQTQASPQAI